MPTPGTQGYFKFEIPRASTDGGDTSIVEIRARKQVEIELTQGGVPPSQEKILDKGTLRVSGEHPINVKDAGGAAVVGAIEVRGEGGVNVPITKGTEFRVMKVNENGADVYWYAPHAEFSTNGTGVKRLGITMPTLHFAGEKVDVFLDATPATGMDTVEVIRNVPAQIPIGQPASIQLRNGKKNEKITIRNMDTGSETLFEINGTTVTKTLRVPAGKKPAVTIGKFEAADQRLQFIPLVQGNYSITIEDNVGNRKPAAPLALPANDFEVLDDPNVIKGLKPTMTRNEMLDRPMIFEDGGKFYQVTLTGTGLLMQTTGPTGIIEHKCNLILFDPESARAIALLIAGISQVKRGANGLDLVLNPEADAQGNKDGKVDNKEIGDYLASKSMTGALNPFRVEGPPIAYKGAFTHPLTITYDSIKRIARQVEAASSGDALPLVFEVQDSAGTNITDANLTLNYKKQ